MRLRDIRNKYKFFKTPEEHSDWIAKRTKKDYRKYVLYYDKQYNKLKRLCDRTSKVYRHLLG